MFVINPPILGYFGAFLLLAFAKFIYLVDEILSRFSLLFCLSVFSLYLYTCNYFQETKFGSYASYYFFGTQQFSSSSNTNVLGASTALKSKAPRLAAGVPLPEITARSYLVVDGNSEIVLLERDSEVKLAPASTTKLVTALVAEDLYSDSDLIEIPEDCTKLDLTKANLPADKEFHAGDLITAMLVSSAGDAACALSSGKLSFNEFVYKMNSYTAKFNLKSTYFTNPIGTDGYENSHYSTARDLYVIARKAVENDFIAQAVKSKYFTIKSADGTFSVNLENTNKLLWEIPQSAGIKTGTTKDAGEVLIYEYKNEAKDLFIVIMGSSDRFSDTRALLNWTNASYKWPND